MQVRRCLQPHRAPAPVEDPRRDPSEPPGLGGRLRPGDRVHAELALRHLFLRPLFPDDRPERDCAAPEDRHRPEAHVPGLAENLSLCIVAKARQRPLSRSHPRGRHRTDGREREGPIGRFQGIRTEGAAVLQSAEIPPEQGLVRGESRPLRDRCARADGRPPRRPHRCLRQGSACRSRRTASARSSG